MTFHSAVLFTALHGPHNNSKLEHGKQKNMVPDLPVAGGGGSMEPQSPLPVTTVPAAAALAVRVRDCFNSSRTFKSDLCHESHSGPRNTLP